MERRKHRLQGIDWTTWLPSAWLRWQITDTAGLALIASYRRTAYQLPLNVLAIGDPAAPFADVSIWNGSSTGPLDRARVGPGTGGDATLTSTRSPAAAAHDRRTRARRSNRDRGPDLYMGISRITKREQPLLDSPTSGCRPSEFTTFQVPDPSFRRE